MEDVPVLRVTLSVRLPTPESASEDWLTLDEIVAGIKEIASIVEVTVSDTFVGPRSSEINVDIVGAKPERRKAHAAIGRFFNREPYQLENQSYDLIAMHAD